MMKKNKDNTVHLEELKAEQEASVEKNGYVVHYDGETSKNKYGGLANIHTHGLPQSFNHTDLQIVLPIHPEVAHGILVHMVEMIKDGHSFLPNHTYQQVLQSDVVPDIAVYIMEARELDRDVLRVVIPDSKGRLPFDDGCEDVYNRQMEPLPDEQTVMH